MKKTFKVIVLIVAIVAILYNCSKQKIKNDFISTVKDDYFYGVDGSVTIGKMLDTICSSGKWSYTPKEVNQYVTYEGTCNGKKLELVFFVYNFGGMSWRVDRMSYGGRDLPDPDENTGFVLYDEYLRHQ